MMWKYIGYALVLGTVFFIGRGMGTEKIQIRYKTCDTHYREIVRMLEGKKVRRTSLVDMR
jgi:hypothetical protein